MVRVQQRTVLRKDEEQASEVPRRRLDVDGDAVRVGNQEVGGRRSEPPLHGRVRVGDVLAVEDGAKNEVVRDARDALVLVGHERVRRQPDARRVHARLREQAGLHDGDEIGASLLPNFQHDAGLG